MEVKARSGRPRKISDRTARRIVRKAIQNPRLTARSLQKDLADTGVVVHYSTIKRYLYKYGLHGRVIRRKPLLRPHHKNQRLNFANEHIDKPGAFWKQVLWTDEVKIELFGRNEQRYFGEERAQNLMKRTSVQLLSMGVDQSCFGVVLQPVAQGTFPE